jgi:hypothetical protein
VDLDHVSLTPRLLQHRRLEDIVDGFAHIQLDEATKALVVILDGEQFVAMQTDNVLDLQTHTCMSPDPYHNIQIPHLNMSTYKEWRQGVDECTQANINRHPLTVPVAGGHVLV